MAFQKLDAVGTFECIVEAPQLGWFDKSSKGSQFIRIPCVVDEAGPHKGKKITWLGYLTSNAYERTEEVLADVFGSNWTWSKIPFAGKRVIIVAEEEEYNGKTQIKAKYLNGVGGGQPKRDQKEALKTSNEIAASLPKREYKPSLEEADEIPF
jgi:hypothetical protein